MKRMLACVSEKHLVALMGWLAKRDVDFQIHFEATEFSMNDDSLVVALFLYERFAEHSATVYKLARCTGYDHVLVDKQVLKNWEQTVPVTPEHIYQFQEFTYWPVANSHRDPMFRRE